MTFDPTQAPANASQPQSNQPVNMHQLLRAMIEKNASDLHITAGSPPQLRIDGELVPLKVPPLNPVQTKELCYSVLAEKQKQQFEETSELDLSFSVKGLARFRSNIFVQKGAVAGAFRTIPFRIMTLTDLGVPPVVEGLCRKPQGLILITGATGSGKSTTLAAMIDLLNSERHLHIITVEDPIEFIHPHKKSIVNQREVGSDTMGFKPALRSILRQDPDVVLVGELRDLETIEAALVIAETGHLCMATLHTNNAVQSINRVIDVFPPHQQEQVRAQLSFVLEGIISQQLVPRASGVGRALGVEIMVPNPAIRNLIREDKVHQIYSQMQMGQQHSGMQTMNQSLYNLVNRRIITVEEALGRTSDPDELRLLLEGGTTARAQPQGRRP
jgi:twitching motility protein PilT